MGLKRIDPSDATTRLGQLLKFREPLIVSSEAWEETSGYNNGFQLDVVIGKRGNTYWITAVESESIASPRAPSVSPSVIFDGEISKDLFDKFRRVAKRRIR